MSDKIYYDDLLQDATITVLSEATSYEKEYAIDKTPETKWRTTGITTETYAIDFGVAVNVKAVAWFESNIVLGDTSFNIKAGTTVAVLDESQALTKAAKGIQDLDWTYRYFRITITKVSGSYIEFGKIALLGSVYEFVRNYNWGATKGLLDVYISNPGEYGQKSKELLFTKKIINVTFKFMDNSQSVLFDETIRLEAYIYYFDDDKSEIWYGETKFSLPIEQPVIYSDINLAFTEVK